MDATIKSWHDDRKVGARGIMERQCKKRAGAAILGIFHDREVRDAVADSVVDMGGFVTEAAA